VNSEFCSKYSWAASALSGKWRSREVENMKHTHQRRSDCPINFALELFGDPWSLLIIRDIVYFGKNTYGEFLASEEGMATNILANRLAHLEHQGLLVKKLSEKDKRKEEYILTEKGLDLIPVLVEMANWSAQHDPHTAAPAAWIALMKAEREKMIRLIRETVQSGGSVFVGEKSLLGQLV
jgi:DNA-binding HxlR family transcriptional regulator